MSEHKISLAFAFLKARPESVARILEQHAVDDVAEFMAKTPQSLAIPVFRHMMPKFEASLCERLEREFVLGILSQMELNQVTAILRYLGKKKREAFLKELPKKFQIGCSFLLSYDLTMVGAWMTPHVIMIPNNCTTKEALHYIRSAHDILYTNYAFVVGSDGDLKGRVRFIDILQAQPHVPVDTIMEKTSLAVTGRLPILDAADSEDWKRYDIVPVKDRHQRFVGVLRHVDLRRGLNHLKAKSEVDPQPEAGFFQVYGYTVVAVLHSMLQTLTTDIHNRKGAAK